MSIDSGNRHKVLAYSIFAHVVSLAVTIAAGRVASKILVPVEAQCDKEEGLWSPVTLLGAGTMLAIFGRTMWNATYQMTVDVICAIDDSVDEFEFDIY